MHPDQVFRAAYLATTYHAAGLAFRFSALETGLVLFAGRMFALISAQNPRSTPLSDEENLARNANLKAVLQARGWAFGDSYGQNLELSWSEAGFVVWDVSLQEMISLAQDFNQNAIVFGQGARIALCWCFSGENEWFYPKVG